MRFFTDFCSKNVLLRKRRHQFRIGFYSVFCLSDTFLRFAVRMHFGSEKPTKNASKMRVEPLKNRCQKRDVFQHWFFRVLASSWRVLAPQDGGKLAPNSIFEFTRLPSLTFLNEKSFKNGILEASGFDFGDPEGRFWRVLEPFLRLFGSLTCYILPPLNWGYHPRNAKILQRLRRLTSFDFNTKRAIGLQWKIVCHVQEFVLLFRHWCCCCCCRCCWSWCCCCWRLSHDCDLGVQSSEPLASGWPRRGARSVNN